MIITILRRLTACFFILVSLSANAVTANSLLELSVERLSSTSDFKKLTDLSKIIQKFISNPANKKELATPAGQQLEQIQSKLVNYFALKSKFSECITDPQNKLQLDNRVSDVFLHLSTCQDEAKSLIESRGTISEVVNELKKKYGGSGATRSPSPAWNRDNALALRSALIMRGYKDALKTYLDINYRYKLSNNKNDTQSMRQKICLLFDNPAACKGGNGMRKLNSDKYDALEKYGEDYQKQLTQHIRPMSSEALRIKLNSNFKLIEKAYASVPADPTSGHLLEGHGYSENDSKKYKDKGGAKAWVQDQLATNEVQHKKHIQGVKDYEAWYRAHLASMTSLSGSSLLATTEISKYFSAPLNYNEENSEARFNRIPNESVIDNAITEAKSEIGRYGHFLSEKDYTTAFISKHELSVDEIKTHVKDIIKNAPAAVAQILVNHPEYAPYVCDAINRINAEKVKADEDANSKTKTYVWGAVIVTGIALTAGGGAVALAAVAPAYAAGLATISSGAIITGAAIGITEGAYYSNIADQHQQEYHDLKSSLIGDGAKDFGAFSQMSQKLTELDDARFYSLAAYGSTAFSMATFQGVIKGMNSLERMKAVSNSIEMLNVGKHNPIRNAKMLSIASSAGEESASKIFTVLAQSGKDAAYTDEILARLSKFSKGDLALLTKTMEESLQSKQGLKGALQTLEKFNPKLGAKKLNAVAGLNNNDLQYSGYAPIDRSSKVKIEDIIKTDKKFRQKLTDTGAKFEDIDISTPFHNQVLTERIKVTGLDHEVTGFEKFGSVLKITTLPSPSKIKTPLTNALTHPDMAKYKKQLEELGYTLVVDTTLPHLGAEAYANGAGKIIALSPDSRWTTFLHEFQHVQFSVYIKKQFKDLEAVVKSGKSIKDVTLDSAIPQHRIKRLEELLQKGIPETGINETLSVDEELKALGFMRYIPGSGGNSSRQYALRHQITALEELKARTGTLSAIQKKTLKLAKIEHNALKVANPAIIGGVITWDIKIILGDSKKRTKIDFSQYKQVVYNQDGTFLVQKKDNTWASITPSKP